MDIPKILIDHIKDGQVVLFLGSGASVGAIHPKNEIPPIGQNLSNIIAEKFLGAEFTGKPLSQIAELSISETNLFTVQDYIASIFDAFHPSGFHKLIPKFLWSAIATTNYDLIIERAYNEVEDKLQQLVVFKKNGERVEEKLRSPNSVFYFKLHGCITDISDTNIPLILTPDQYVTHKKGRSRLFERLQGLSYEFPILFVGHSLSDLDIRAILLELVEIGEARPRSYLLTPNITDPEVRFWESKKITCIQMSFEDFLNQINTSIPDHVRKLSTLRMTIEHPIVKRFRVSDKVKPSESLMTCMTRDVDYIHKDIKTTDVDPKAFYKGYFLDLSPIIYDLDVKRIISSNIMSEVFLLSEEERTDQADFYLLKGHAGSGKSVILKRLSWDASVDFDKLCLSLKSSSILQYDALVELHRLCSDRIFLFIDSVSKYIDIIELFINRARKDKLPLTIVGTERYNEWNIHCERLEAYLTDSYEIKYLREGEIKELIHLLTINKSLGYLEGKSVDEQTEALSKKAGRQLLVALHEATLGKPFSDIVFDEYNSIMSHKAQSLYLTVCILHRLGIETRAGLISRVHNIPFILFRDSLFKPLEFIVFAQKNSIINDYVYRSRHSHIAEIVFERVLVKPQDRYDEYIRIINALDIDYNSDWEALNKIINAKQLISLFPDPQMIRSIYDSANKRIGNDPLLMQQEAIFEMSSSDGSLDKADKILKNAMNNVKTQLQKKYIQHSLSEVALKRSKKASTALEKLKYRKESRKIALELIADPSITVHPLHTLIKIGIDELKELLDQEDPLSIERKIKEVEENIAKAMQQFPDDSFILSAEATLSTIIKKHPKARESLQKAFNINKRSTYIAVRLAKLYEEDDDDEKAIGILKDCVEANPIDRHAHYKLATLLCKSIDSNPEEIKHHLKNSFTEGDSNYIAQFWYARFLYLENSVDDAFKLFKKLGEARLDVRIKKEPRGLVKEDGLPKRYTGTISKMESSYGFIMRDKYNDRIFAHCNNTDRANWEHLKYAMRVTFELAFTYRGATALRIKKEKSF